MKFKLGKRTRFRELKVGDWFVWGSTLFERISMTRLKRNARCVTHVYGYPPEWTLGPSEIVYPIEVDE